MIPGESANPNASSENVPKFIVEMLTKDISEANAMPAHPES